jgi:pyruvate kinase
MTQSFISPENLYLQRNMLRTSRQNTKIVATVGPASSSFETLLDLVRAGVDIFRLNFSHGAHADKLEIINHINYINGKYNTHIGILADLQGPKLRVGEMENNGLLLNEGDIVTFVNEPCVGNMEKIYMSYQQFPQDVEVGEKVMVDDGKLVFEVVETNKKDTVRLKTLYGGILSSKKGVNLPDTNVSQPSLTPKDLVDLEFILTQPSINWVALSFVRKAEDVTDLVNRLAEGGHQAKVMSKIEKPEAVKNIDEIIKVSNGIMVARGDLGVEMPIERLPHVQKEIVKKCMQWARPVIVATQMMESMMTNPSPTRAETTDVANAVLDGADAVMLSGETAAGKHPVQVVEYMSRIIQETEKHYREAIENRRPVPNKKARTYLSDMVCFKAGSIAEDIGAKGVVGMTSSGYTAFKVSSFRPNCSIFMFSDQPNMLATMNLCWGVQCFYYDRFTTTDETISDTTEILKNSGFVKDGDIIVNTGSMPIEKRYRTNMLRITLVD